MIQCPYCQAQNKEDAKLCRACGAPLHGFPFLGPQPLPIGTVLKNGRYEIKEVLGQGGFGITYKCWDITLKRFVAIKELAPNGYVARDGLDLKIILAKPDPLTAKQRQETFKSIKEKFLGEGQILAQFKHPNIAEVFDFFEENNTAYLVTEFLPGRTILKELEEKGWVDEEEAVNYILKVCDALDVVHKANWLHRDIKPENIMLTDDGRVVLIDFGIARPFAIAQAVLTTGVVSDGYSPPEQYGQWASEFKASTDIYALGATLYHLLTGEIPTPAMERYQGVPLLAPKQTRPEISQAISDAVMKAMELNMEKRPQSIEEFRQLISVSSSLPQQVPLSQPIPKVKPTSQKLSYTSLARLSENIGEIFGRISGALSGFIGGLAVGIATGILLLMAGIVLATLAGAFLGGFGGGALGGESEESGCGSIIGGMIVGGLIGYYLGIIVGILMAVGSCVGGMVLGGVRGVRIGGEVGSSLGEKKGVATTSLLLSACTSAILGVSWMGFFQYTQPTNWKDAGVFAGFVLVVGSVLGSILGSLVFWIAVKRAGGTMPPKEQIVAFLSAPIGFGIAYSLFSFLIHLPPQKWSFWLVHWIDFHKAWLVFKHKIVELVRHYGGKLFSPGG